jgi:glycosyltransferase involved in cell wall biosynthesis
VKNISLFIIAKNEGDKIRQCIESAKGLVREVILVDSSSEDNTVAEAEAAGAKVYQHEFKGFAIQKNYALSKCTSEWALSLDADEVLSPELVKEIEALPDNPEVGGYELLRVNYFLGGRMNHSGLDKEYILRLVRTKDAKYKDVLVHESLEITGGRKRLKQPMYHYSYSDLETYFDKFNKYTTLAARDLYNKGRSFSLIGTLLRLPFDFFKRYILKRGFRDGIRGFIWSMVSTFYGFIKYIKLWDIHRREK